MRYIILLLFFIITSIICKSQTPEAGWFWSLRKQQLNRNSEGEFKGMGWEETPTGKYAFEFSDSVVIIYSNGWMGKDYKKQERYPVIQRERVSEDDNGYSVYEYFATYKGEPTVKFLVQVKNDNYDLAFISVYDTFINNKFMKVISYGCSRKYK